VQPRVAILKSQNYHAWQVVRARAEAAGDLGPYSVNHLRNSGFDLLYSDSLFEPPWSWPFVDRWLGRIEWRSQAFAGMRNVIANRKIIRCADITLGIFEENGSFVATMQTTPARRLFPSKVALLVCWMAERAQRARRRTLASYRRVIAGADQVFYFSPNQTELFTEYLRADPAKLHPVDFGIDYEFFASPAGPRDEGYVLAVGGDSSRDHELLVEAVRGTDISTRIYAPRLNVEELAPNVTWISRVIPHVEYREVLAGARIVVVPTHGVAYPGGQTVILEAMASGKPVIATRSPALAHYIDDGVTGVLSPRGDPEALRGTIQELLDDPHRRERIANAGLRSVQTRFNQRRMWATIGAHLHSLL
jgi:hypothetical protein